ncbi:MAG: 3-dehydroquinate synthase [Parachlamydiaceae bacterium]|nr:3-dehydroquinate synthase [Parachlamydiaceae bacterium]
MIQRFFCTIPNVSNAYEIEIGRGILNSQIKYLSNLASRFAIITDDIVAPLYGKKLEKLLSSSGLKVNLFSFPSGEQHKTRTTKELLENNLFEKGFGRDSCVIALGGGVVTDIAGYLAATYCRGIPLVMIPTSLLGMVDASIGGKTGVNVSYGKNLLGCIYHPKKVVIDILTLKSLPKYEFANGVVEMIKHGLVADHHLFEYLENNALQLLALDLDVVEKAIFESCRIKKEIVEQDERERGKRHLLNFGHTIGHALENLTHYTLSHGEAVAIGLLVESYLSLKLKVLDSESFERIKRILIQYDLPLKLPFQFPISRILEAMAFDKKSIKGQARFVTIEKIGSPQITDSSYCVHVEEILVKEALQWMNDDLYSY